ncbi:MAG TPA: SIR2 family protein [Flavisolibacter sp.]|jgi:hypothetical protein|nr:SIR2 family protein [Flavisolibacter sp.]
MAAFTHDLTRELSEIRNQLSYSKRLGFLFGAGTSKALGMSDISSLTKKVKDQLCEEGKTFFSKIDESLEEDRRNIEGVLNKVRLIRQLTSDKEHNTYDSISGKNAKDLDIEICSKIYNILSEEEKEADLQITKKLIIWLNWISRDFAKEIFTTNYDLILEKSFENLLIPFYDGFIGSHEPFFAHESIDGKSKYDRPPISWIRLWKLHGSLSWFWKEDGDNKSNRIVRLCAGAKNLHPHSELVIYPSRDKYESSRKQPFTSYFDRLKEFLLSGEGIFIISGYSFSDDHVNEIIFNGLNQNNRLHAICFFYNETPIDSIVKQGKNFPNMTLISPTKSSIASIEGEWRCDSKSDLTQTFWDVEKKRLLLGDFKHLVDFLIFCTGLKERINDNLS